MKKQVALLICCIIFALVLSSCAKKGDAMQEMDKEKSEMIEQLFTIDLPEKGNLLYYESTLADDALGNIYAEIELDKSFYQDIHKQIEENYHIEESEINIEEMEKFDTKKEDVSEIYISMDSLRRDVEIASNEVPFTQYYFIYVTKVTNGAFRLLCVAEGC